MDIGDVVNVKIHGEYSSCVILDKKTYFELYSMWTSDSRHLIVDYGNGGSFVGQSLQYCPTSLIGYGQLGSQSMCYQLLYGDQKVWTRRKMIEKYDREA